MTNKKYRLMADQDLLDMYNEKKRPILRRWERLMNNRSMNEEQREEARRLELELDLIRERMDSIMEDMARVIFGGAK